MKKLLTLMTMCVLVLSLATSAMAATILQDEQPPKLLTEDSALTLADIHDRAVVENEQVKNRLNNAYTTVLDAVYHSDLLDSAAMDAHDLVLFELFDADFAAEQAAGGKELTLEIPDNVSAAVVLFTADGINWEVLPAVINGNTVTVQLPAPGTLTMLCNAQYAQRQEEEVFIPVQGEVTEEVSNFTPSVSGKNSPAVVTSTSADGETIVGSIIGANGEVVAPVPDRNYVVTAAVAERDHVLDIMTHEYLEAAYEDILNAENVGELNAEGEGTIAAALDAYLQNAGYGLSADMLVVKDLFEVSAYGDYLHYIGNEDYYLEMTFDAGLTPGQPVVVLHTEDGETWHVHENVTFNADGTLTMQMHNLGVVAFLVEAEYNVDAQDAVQAP